MQVVAVLVLLASYELAIRQVVGRRLEQGKTLPRRLRFLNAFVETSVPSILILLGSRQVDPVYPLESAGGGAGEGPRRADRDLSPCLNGLNYDVVEIAAVFHGARLFRLDRER